jgi:Co/Zn/Cd efflux system component
MSRNTHTHEDAARYGAKANALLGLAQVIFGALTGNIGFISESVHQASDSVSLGAKSKAMNSECAPTHAKRLRRFAASILLTGGLIGVAGGVKHIHEGSTENHGQLEVIGATLGALVNTAVARRSHGATYGDETDNTHSHGAAHDSTIHIMTDTATGWIYAGALVSEARVPGISNAALLLNGMIVGSAGMHTMHRINQDEPNAR